MATCKDCLSEKVCKYKDQPIPLSDSTYSESNNVEKSGCPFKDKNRFVEIPCYCKECEHFNNYNPDRTYCEEHSDGWGDNRVYVDEDDYCSFGIKKKGGADNG